VGVLLALNLARSSGVLQAAQTAESEGPVGKRIASTSGSGTGIEVGARWSDGGFAENTRVLRFASAIDTIRPSFGRYGCFDRPAA
jgi:hypothetical protein